MHPLSYPGAELEGGREAEGGRSGRRAFAAALINHPASSSVRFQIPSKHRKLPWQFTSTKPLTEGGVRTGGRRNVVHWALDVLDPEIYSLRHCMHKNCAFIHLLHTAPASVISLAAPQTRFHSKLIPRSPWSPISSPSSRDPQGRNAYSQITHRTRPISLLPG